jgi:hypothetical protein
MCKKADVLDDGGYRFDYHRGTYVNRSRKALFSHRYVDASSAEEIEALIKSVPADNKQWKFFCFEQPTGEFRKIIEDGYERRVRPNG